jgi:hypothetical protein
MLSRILPDSGQASSFRKSKIMMRIGLIVVGLGTLTVMELGTPSRTKTSAPDPFEQLAVEVSLSRDTLERADRLETHYLQDEVPVQPISPVEPALPPDVTAIVPEEDSNIAGRGTNDKKEVVRKPKPKPKHTTPNKPRPKLTTPTKLQSRNERRRWSRSSRVVQMLSIACFKH